MKKKLLWSIVILIFVTNAPGLSYFFQENFSYSNADESFKYVEENRNKSYWGCQRAYGHFLCQHPQKDQGDNRLYRNFTIKPWQFWQWGELIFHSERFALPYKELKH